MGRTWNSESLFKSIKRKAWLSLCYEAVHLLVSGTPPAAVSVGVSLCTPSESVRKVCHHGYPNLDVGSSLPLNQMCLCAKGGILLFDPYTKSVSYRFNNNITSNYVNLISDSCFFLS